MLQGFHSLSCETYGGTQLRQTWEEDCGFYSLPCETYSGTVRPKGQPVQGNVSIRCRARRAAELAAATSAWAASSWTFLFAAVRDVQRNPVVGPPGLPLGFYSLPCETYSGAILIVGYVTEYRFLFAVVRDVQRNTARRSTPAVPRCFYSLSCETYSGTPQCVASLHHGTQPVSIRCRARRTA